MARVDNEKVMIARVEGGDWEIISIHSLVLGGMRWDVVNGWNREPYSHTPEEIEANQRARAEAGR